MRLERIQTFPTANVPQLNASIGKSKDKFVDVGWRVARHYQLSSIQRLHPIQTRLSFHIKHLQHNAIDDYVV